jgi:hypothetical protein
VRAQDRFVAAHQHGEIRWNSHFYISFDYDTFQLFLIQRRRVPPWLPDFLRFGEALARPGDLDRFVVALDAGGECAIPMARNALRKYCLKLAFGWTILLTTDSDTGPG